MDLLKCIEKLLALHKKQEEQSSPLALPEDIMCAICGEVIPRKSTMQIYMPSDDSDFQRICQRCAIDHPQV